MISRWRPCPDKKEQPTHVTRSHGFWTTRSVSGRRRSVQARYTQFSVSHARMRPALCSCDRNNGRSTRNPEPSDHRATYVGLRGAAGVAALTAAAPLASVPTTTVTVQQARSAIGLPRSSKENDKQLKAILSTVAGGQLRPAVAQPCRWRAPRPRRCVDRCRGCHRFTSVDSWMRQRGRRLDPWRATAPRAMSILQLQTHSIPPPRLEPRPCSPSSVLCLGFLSCYT